MTKKVTDKRAQTIFLLTAMHTITLQNSIEISSTDLNSRLYGEELP